MNNSLRRSIQQILLAGSTAVFAAGAFSAITPGQQNPPPGPGQVPDYFGVVPNYANSPQPVLTEVLVNGVGAGSAASASPTLAADGGISGFKSLIGGSGYVSPTVTITDLPLGIGAAISVINDGTANSISVTLAGSNYSTDSTKPPVVTITDASDLANPIVINTTATVDPTGIVTGIVTDPAILATLATLNAPTTTVTIVDAVTGSGATATAVTSGTDLVAGKMGVITAINVDAGSAGSGYRNPTVQIVDAAGAVGGSGAVLVATTYDYTLDAQTDKVMDVQVLNGGSSYDAHTTVTINGGPGVTPVTVTPEITGGMITGIVEFQKPVTAAGYVGVGSGFKTPIAGTGIHKFVDALPGLVLPNATPAEIAAATNGLKQNLPVAVADTTTFPGSDYYEIAETEYAQQLHSDLPVTHLRGYKQLNAPAGSPSAKNQYLGPIIVAQKGRAVRIKLVNQLSTGVAGKLPVPVDTTYMGADSANATDNRTALHLHGGNTPWISDGTPRQWVKPAGETGANKGETTRDVPDMWFDASGAIIPTCAGKLSCATGSNNPGDGSMTFYYTNQQSARLMFYHDHAEGITRLNVYDGMAAAYLLQDPTEQAMISGGTAYAAAQTMGYTGAELAKYDNTVFQAVLPPLADTIPLVIQEKTFVPNNTRPVMNYYSAFASQLQSQDPTWRWGTNFDATGNVISNGETGNGDLWVPHVFMPNQNPGDISGGNAVGRWDYGPWFWPPFTAIANGPIDNPYYDPTCVTTTQYCEPSMIPGVPNGSTIIPDGGYGAVPLSPGVKDANTGNYTSSPSGTPEAFNDTPLVNGTAYPYIKVDPKQYRLRILSVGNDRMLNLSMVIAASKKSVDTTAAGNAGAANSTTLCDGADTSINQADCTEVKMVPFDTAQNKAKPFPTHWYTTQKGGVTFDGRPSGVFDPATRGPAMVQIGTEGGFLSAPVVIKNQPVNYEYNPKNILIGNIKEHALLLGPAERADVLVDFSNYAGSTLILYNDAGAPVPAWDLRLDYYTGNYDNTDTGGAFSTIPGYGPNSRTIMQIRVSNNGGTVAANAASSRDSTGNIKIPELTTAVQTAFRTSQEPIIVPQAAYNTVYGTNVPDSLGTDLSRIADSQLTFNPLADASVYPATLEPTAVTMDMSPKTIIEDWTMNWGRMNALLGTEVPRTNATIQTSIPQAFIDPPTELVKITSNTSATPITGTLADGTSLWKITHNGVDSHSIHFHLFHVQLVNRVGWDGAVYPPELNELGWKDSVLMHPLSDVVVALRPMTMDLPFKVANSHRKIDPSMAAKGLDYFNLDPITGNASNVSDASNAEMNYGWEYLWHCHILGHEENDMMRTIAVAQPPEAPLGLVATTVSAGANKGVKLDWTDNSMTSNWVEIQRATDTEFVNDTTNATVGNPVTKFNVKLASECASQTGCARTWTDTDANSHTTTTYFYKLVANNTVGGGAGRADAPLAAVAGGGFTYGDTLPTEVQSLLPNGIGYTGYANVTASSDPAFASRIINAPMASVVPGSIVFPVTDFEKTTPINALGHKVITISNTGGAPLNIASIGLTGSFARGTSGTTTNALYRGSCPTSATFSLNGGQSCTYNVTFSPTVAKCNDTSCIGTLTVTDNSGFVVGAQQFVDLSGTAKWVAPAKPSGLGTANVTQTGLTLNWTAVAVAKTYTVQMSTVSTFTAATTTTTQSVLTNSLAVSGLTPNTRYYFRVAAVNPAGTSVYSNSSNTYTLLNEPTNVAAANGTAGGTITAGLTWTAVGGASSYQVRYSTNQSMNGAAIVSNVTSGTQINVGGIARTEYMQVRAVGANNNNSAWTTVGPVTVLAK